MPNRIRKGCEATPYTYNTSQVSLNCAVSPALKDAIADVAYAQGVPLKEVIAVALEEYLLAVNA